VNFRSLCAPGIWYVLGIGFTAFASAHVQSQTVAKASAGILGQKPAAKRTIDRTRYPAYSLIAAQLSLPNIAAAAERVLEIDGTARLDFAAANESPAASALAAQMRIPLSAMKGLIRQLANETELTGPQLAASFRTELVDYKFLEERWNQFHPAGTALQVKQAALAALEAGDLERAWTLFEDLPKPRPPRQLRVKN